MRSLLKAAIIHVFTPKTNYSRLLNQGFEQAKSNVKLLLYGSKSENLSDLPNAKNVWTSTLFPIQIFAQLLKDSPQVAHIQYEFTTFGSFWTNILYPLLLLLTKLTGTKIVVTVHSVIPKEAVDEKLMQQLLPQVPKNLFGQALFKTLLVYLYASTNALSDKIIVHGNWYKKALVNSYKASAAKIVVIPYGVDEDSGEGEAFVSKWQAKKNGKKIILFFGNISPRKDVETLLRAFAIFTEAHCNYMLVIAGKDASNYKGYSDQLKALSSELGVSQKILFTGFIHDGEIHVLYRLSDFIAFPYLYGFEGPSGPLSFAIQYGLPVVGTNVGHLAEEIRHMQDGILVTPRDVNGFAKAMGILASNEELRESFSRYLKSRADGMMWTDVATRTVSVYASCNSS